MSDVGLGQLVTTTGRARSRKLKDAVQDNIPTYDTMEQHGGIREEDGGRTVVEEGKTAQNTTVSWVGESGTVALDEVNVLDAAEFDWSYMLGSVVFTLAEQYKNSGGSDTKLINLVGGKFEVLEDSEMNIFEAAMLSDGTGTGGLQMMGLAGLVSTTPTSGTVGSIDRSATAAAWFRNTAATSTTAVGSATTNAGNILQFFDYFMDSTIKGAKIQQQLILAGSTHWSYANQALQGRQQFVNVSGTAKGGFDKLMYRGTPIYQGGGINYSGESAQTATRSYGLNVKPGGVNLVFHNKARFDMLEPIQSADQAAISRLMFTMSCMTIGALAKRCWVGYDG